MLEKEIEKKLHDEVQNLHCGAKCLKFVSPGYSGVPDRIILLPGGKVVFVELKAPKKKERARQEYVQRQFRNLDFTVFSTVNTVDKAKEVIEYCKKWCANYQELKCIGVAKVFTI